MSCLGVHFALTEDEISKLRSFKNEQDRLGYLKENIEEAYFNKYPEHLAESDKAWDTIHEVLKGTKYPLNYVILDGEPLYTGSDYIMSLKTPKQVKDIAEVLKFMTEEKFKRLYLSSHNESRQPTTNEGFGHTWEWFQNVRDLYSRASNNGRYILFTADQ